jgi:large subunit ribosomal protein L22
VTGPKLNERPVLRTRPDGPARAVANPGVQTRAVARYVRMSAYKVREVLDLVRGQDAERAQEILRFSEREAAALVGKVLASAVANAEHNEQIAPEELFVAACYADEGPTLKRWRPRARGRATRIRKRTCHVTVIVSRLPDSELRKRRAARAPTATDRRRRRGGAASTPSPERERRVRASRRGQAAAPTPTPAPATPATTPDEPPVPDETAEPQPTVVGDASTIAAGPDEAPTTTEADATASPEEDDERTE